MKRWLPPLLVLLVLGFVVWRVQGDPRRDADRKNLERLAGSAFGNPEGVQQFVASVEDYLGRYGDRAEDRWYAARLLLHSHLAGPAIDTVWRDPGLRRDLPDATRRLGRLLLLDVAFDDPVHMERPQPPISDVVTSVLADGGDPQALERFDTLSGDNPLPRWASLYFTTWFFGSQALQRRMLDELRAKQDLEADLAAARLQMGPDPYPERDADLGRLKEEVESDARQKRRPDWAISCLALGRSEDAGALDALEGVVNELAKSSAPNDRADAAMASIGLVAGGRWAAEARVLPQIPFERPVDMLLLWYLDAVVHRYRRGDSEAFSRIETWWKKGARGGPLSARPRLAIQLCLVGPAPPQDGPVAKLVEDLAAPDVSAEERVLRDAVGLRWGEAGSADRLVTYLKDTLGSIEPRQDPGFKDPLPYSPLLQAERALYLYGGSSAH